MSCTELTRADDRATTPEAGALFPPPGFPAGGHGDSRRRPLPFAAPTRASPAREAAESPVADSPARRGAPLAEPADDIVALIAVALFVGALVAWLDALAGVPGGV
jgi:hypothetical protein